MKERTVVTSMVGLLAAAGIVAVGGTDVVFVAAAVAFFALCIAYAEGCEKL